MHQIGFRLWLRPRPRWGSLQRSPRPPCWIWGPLRDRGRSWSGEEEGKGWGRGGRGKWMGGKGRTKKFYCWTRAPQRLATRLVLLRAVDENGACCLFVCVVSASESDTTSSQINCSHAVDAEAGSPVSLPCNISCVSTNTIAWYYYHEQHRTANATRVVVYNGEGGPVNPLWSARGVNVSQNNKVSVLTIAEVTTDLTGVYECAPNTNVSGGCNVRFCLTTGERFSMIIFISWVRQHTTIHKLQKYRAKTQLQDNTKEIKKYENTN